MNERNSSLPTFYKFTKPEYAVGLTRRGETLVGTLHGFQDVERLGTEIGDQDEGVLQRETWLENEAIGAGNDRPAIVRETPAFSGLQYVKFEGRVGFQATHREPNRYIYCVTTSFTERHVAEFGPACVRIDDPRTFFREMQRLLGPPVNHFQLVECFYESRTVNYDDGIPTHPAQLKDPKFEWQCEARAIFDPPIDGLQPRKVRSSRLAKCCTLIKV